MNPELAPVILTSHWYKNPPPPPAGADPVNVAAAVPKQIDCDALIVFEEITGFTVIKTGADVSAHETVVTILRNQVLVVITGGE